jgi:hypothetical protein
VADDDSTFNDCFTLFLDFLGSSAATTWPRERQYNFVDLLISIAQIKSERQIDGEAQADGSYKITMQPDITTFSDHIVVSYPGIPKEHYGSFILLLWMSCGRASYYRNVFIFLAPLPNSGCA